MNRSVALRRKYAFVLALLLLVILVFSVVLGIRKNDTQVAGSEAMKADSPDASTRTSDSSGLPSPTSANSAPGVEPLTRESVIPGTGPKAGIIATCDSGQPDLGPGERLVTVYFHCDAPDEESLRNVAPVRRAVEDSPAVLESSLRALLAGPTEDERGVGFSSPFSAGTADLLGRVSINDEKVATVDFADDFRRLSSVGTTAGSGLVYQELNRTIFQFDTVWAIVYTLNGSAAAWCEFHGAECGEVRRQVGTYTPRFRSDAAILRARRAVPSNPGRMQRASSRSVQQRQESVSQNRSDRP